MDGARKPPAAGVGDSAASLLPVIAEGSLGLVEAKCDRDPIEQHKDYGKH